MVGAGSLGPWPGERGNENDVQSALPATARRDKVIVAFVFTLLGSMGAGRCASIGGARFGDSEMALCRCCGCQTQTRDATNFAVGGPCTLTSPLTVSPSLLCSLASE